MKREDRIRLERNKIIGNVYTNRYGQKYKVLSYEYSDHTNAYYKILFLATNTECIQSKYKIVNEIIKSDPSDKQKIAYDFVGKTFINKQGLEYIVEKEVEAIYHNRRFDVRFIKSGYTITVYGSSIRDNELMDRITYNDNLYKVRVSNCGLEYVILSVHYDSKGNVIGRIKFIKSGNEYNRYMNAIYSGKVTDHIEYDILHVAKSNIDYHKAVFSNNRLWFKWYYIISKCYNESDRSYKSFGKKGIIVCERWLTYENFKEDIELINIKYDDFIIKLRPGKTEYRNDNIMIIERRSKKDDISKQRITENSGN